MQNLLDRLVREEEGIERRKKQLKEALDKEEIEEIECERCDGREAVTLKLTEIVANNLEIQLEENDVHLCHDCISDLLTHPTRDYDVAPKERKKVKKKREELRGLSKEEIAEQYGISGGYAGAVIRAISPNCFRVLSNESLTNEEKAEELGVSKSTISLYLAALEKVGIKLKEEE